MANNLDSLKNSITDWMSEKSQARAGSRSQRVVSGKMSELAGIKNLQERTATAKQMGIDPETAKSIKSHMKDVVKLNSSLSRLMLEQNVQFKDAVGLLKKQKMELRGTNELSELQYRRQIKLLGLLEKQYQIQRKTELLNKAFKGIEPVVGKTSSKMLKHAVTGKGKGAFDSQVAALSKKMPQYAKAFAVAGRVMTGTLGLVVGIVHGLGKVIVQGVQTMFDSMNKIFDQGIAGILNSVVDMAKQLGGMLSSTLGGLIGSIGSLLVKRYMLMLELQISRSQMGAKTAFRTGRGPEAGEEMFSGLMKVTGGIRSLANEWSEEFSKLGDIGSQAFRKSVYTTATMFQQTSNQAFTDLNRLLMVNNNNFKTAGRDYNDALLQSRRWAKQTKINADNIKNAFLDTAVATRYLNTDLKSVEGTISILAKNQEALQQAGISLKKDLGNITKGIQEIPGAWDYAQHALMGMREFGAESVAEGYVKSRFNLKEKGQGVSYEGGGSFGFKGVSAKDRAALTQGGMTKEGWGARIEGMKKHLAEVLEKEGIDPKSEEALIKSHEFLKGVYKVNSEQLRTALLFSKDYDSLSGENKSLLTDAGKSEKEILSGMKNNIHNLYTVAQKGEQWQMRIAGMIPILIALLIHLPAKVANEMTGGLLGKTGANAFNKIWQSVEESSNAATGHIKKMLEPIVQGVRIAKRAEIGAEMDIAGGYKSYMKNLETKAIDARFYQEMDAEGHTITQAKKNEMEAYEKMRLAHEYNTTGLTIGNKTFKYNKNIIGAKNRVNTNAVNNFSEDLSKNNTNTTNISNTGSTTNIHIRLDKADPDTVTDAVRAHIAKNS